jgi:hypothetical protein
MAGGIIGSWTGRDWIKFGCLVTSSPHLINSILIRIKSVDTNTNTTSTLLRSNLNSITISPLISINSHLAILDKSRDIPRGLRTWRISSRMMITLSQFGRALRHRRSGVSFFIGFQILEAHTIRLRFKFIRFHAKPSLYTG